MLLVLVVYPHAKDCFVVRIHNICAVMIVLLKDKIGLMK